MKVGNLEVYGVIYKITNKINGKVYIGQTTRGFDSRYWAKGEGIERVYNYHLYYKNRGDKKQYNLHILESIEKHGFKNFNVNKVFDVAFSKEELDIKEISYIRLFNSVANGYNICEGGRCGPIRSGEKHYKAKYSEDQIILAKKMYCEGVNPNEIERITQVDKNSLSVITSLNSWIDVGKEYNNKLKEMQDLRRYRRAYNVKDNELELRRYYDLGMTPIEVCKELNLINKDYKVEESKKCSSKNYKDIVSMFRVFKYRDLNRVKICQNCNKEYLIPLSKKVTNNRKYCYSCAKK